MLQAVYLSHLIVDANGVLVLLKQVNQDYSQIDDSQFRTFSDSCEAIIVDRQIDIPKSILAETVCPLLHLIYRVCKGQSDRIKPILIKYKSVNIMTRLCRVFEQPEVQAIAHKVIKMQVKYMDKTWIE